MSVSDRFWKSMQHTFGFVHRSHRFDVPTSVRIASHEQSNETQLLRAELNRIERRDDALRGLVCRMQQRLENRSH